MQTRNRDHHQAPARKDSAADSGENDLPRRSSRFAASRRKDPGARSMVSAGRVARTRPERRQNSHPRRSRHGDFLERQHGRTQGRHADALQHRVQHRAGRANVHARPQRHPPRRPPVLPFLRLHGDAVAARGARRRRRVPPQPPRSRGRQRTRPRLSRHVPARHAHVPAGVHAALLAGRLRQPAIRGRRRRKASRARRGRVRGPLRHPPARRLRRHGMFARGRRQHA